MRKRTPLSILSVLLVVCAGIWIGVSVCRRPLPLCKQVGRLVVSVDPRMELLGAVQSVSDYRLVRRNGDYSKRTDDYFGPYAGLPAVSLTERLADKDRFSYDAPVEFMLHLEASDACEPCIPYSDYLVRRAGSERILEDYRQAVRRFAEESDFRRFWNRNRDFYRKVLDRSVAELGDVDWIGSLEAYYNESQHSYNIVVAPLFEGGYGLRLPAGNGKWDLYACVSADAESEDGVPYLDRAGSAYYLWHEFGHSYVNPVVERYADRVAATAGLFGPLRAAMLSQGYGSWQTCVCEHIVRAVHIRLTEICMGGDAAARKLEEEQRRRFAYIVPLVEKLKRYEAVRNRDGITFSDYLPQLLGVFDSIAASSGSGVCFSGPINAVFASGRYAVVYPTGGPDRAVQERIRRYAEAVCSRFFKDGLCIPDTTALDTDVSEYGLVVYGTPGSNLFLKKYRDRFPFSVEGETLVAGRNYADPGIKLATCLPNPQNPALGMIVYTAASDDDIEGINNVFHGAEDYVLFTDREHVLNRGFYKKEAGGWRF